jgi:hypothetical protein
MTNVREPRAAVGTKDGDGRGPLQDGELARLVRRWMAAGPTPPERPRRDTVLRVAPEPSERSAVAPRLPHRDVQGVTDHASRVAVLIDARRLSSEAATGLLSLLGERGMVSVCRAYADWGRSELSDWVDQARRHGLHSFHQYADDDDQALVAMAIDAVDIARDATVDEVVIAGDLTSSLPLVHRLHAAGVRVVGVGAGFTPHDVRAACDHFIDACDVTGEHAAPAGRHRA